MGWVPCRCLCLGGGKCFLLYKRVGRGEEVYSGPIVVAINIVRTSLRVWKYGGWTN